MLAGAPYDRAGGDGPGTALLQIAAAAARCARPGGGNSAVQLPWNGSPVVSTVGEPPPVALPLAALVVAPSVVKPCILNTDVLLRVSW